MYMWKFNLNLYRETSRITQTQDNTFTGYKKKIKIIIESHRVDMTKIEFNLFTKEKNVENRKLFYKVITLRIFKYDEL